MLANTLHLELRENLECMHVTTSLLVIELLQDSGHKSWIRISIEVLTQLDPILTGSGLGQEFFLLGLDMDYIF